MQINNSTAKKSSFKTFSLSSIPQLCQSTTLRGFSPMVQYSGSVYLEINKSTAKKSSFRKIFSFSNFSNFVNLRFYTFFYLWYNIQHLYILKKTNRQHKKPNLKNFLFIQFLQFCQTTILHSFSLMLQYSGFVHLEINKSTGKK